MALKSLGLLMTRSSGECLPAPSLLESLTEDIDRPEHIPFPLGLCIFERMIGDERFQSRLEDALRFWRIQAKAISVEWCYVPFIDKRNSAWIWLQQLGLGHHDGVALQLTRHLEPYVLDAGFGSVPLSQAELDLRLLAQRRRAVLAEDYVVLLEKARLRAIGSRSLQTPSCAYQTTMLRPVSTFFRSMETASDVS